MPRTSASRTRRAVVAVAAVGVVASGTLAVATALRPEDRASTRTASVDADAAYATPAPEAPLDEIGQQMEQRRIFALRSDRAYVEEVAAAPDAVESDWRGLRITPAEAAEFARQDGLHPKLEEMTAILEPLGALGGVWLENPVAEPQVMVVAIVGEVGADVRQRLLDVGGADPLRLVAAQHTERQLRDLCDALVAGPLWAAGALNECSADVVGDRVAVGVDLDAPADTEARLAAEHGDVVSATRQPPASASGG
ncbi:hypothetical protein BFL36_11515 [Clavibacter michiganensis]|uniref:Uncharacterized protein n=1 Tax=Clavibacter michiganensis TaxID=28447 RepID=A0A251Y7N6_9MICO|nr:hypothetical protein [Clavibacter michiganensis]OUE20284.1 hypothetical protein BFL36_11515 [Clavibacter michiganensis]